MALPFFKNVFEPTLLDQKVREAIFNAHLDGPVFFDPILNFRQNFFVADHFNFPAFFHPAFDDAAQLKGHSHVRFCNAFLDYSLYFSGMILLLKSH